MSLFSLPSSNIVYFWLFNPRENAWKLLQTLSKLQNWTTMSHSEESSLVSFIFYLFLGNFDSSSSRSVVSSRTLLWNRVRGGPSCFQCPPGLCSTPPSCLSTSSQQVSIVSLTTQVSLYRYLWLPLQHVWLFVCFSAQCAPSSLKSSSTLTPPWSVGRGSGILRPW